MPTDALSWLLPQVDTGGQVQLVPLSDGVAAGGRGVTLDARAGFALCEVRGSGNPPANGYYMRVDVCTRRPKSEPECRLVFDPPWQWVGSISVMLEKGEGVCERGSVDAWISG